MCTFHLHMLSDFLVVLFVNCQQIKTLPALLGFWSANHFNFVYIGRYLKLMYQSLYSIFLRQRRATWGFPNQCTQKSTFPKLCLGDKIYTICVESNAPDIHQSALKKKGSLITAFHGGGSILYHLHVLCPSIKVYRWKTNWR